MKKYLNNNISKIRVMFFVVIFGFIAFSSSVFAQTKIEYYKKLFGSSFGFIIYEEDKDTSLKKDYISSDPAKGYLILLSSDIPQKVDAEKNSVVEEVDLERYLGKNSKVIIVCDSLYTSKIPLSFTCDKSDVNSDQLENIGGFLKTNDSQKLGLYVIPENLLVSPDKRSDIENYFKALKRSDAALSISEDTKVVTKVVQIVAQVKALLNTSTFETFGIAFSMLIIVSLYFGLLKFLSSENKKKLDSSVLKRIFLQISEYFISHRWVTICVLIIMLLVYIPIIVTLGVKDGQGESVGYFITYSLDTFKVTNLVNYTNQGDYFRIVIFFYNFIFLIILATLFIPSLINTLLIAASKIGNAKLKPGIHKYAIPFIIILSIIVSSFFKTSESHRFLIFMVVVLAFIIINNLKYKTFEYRYSLREKMIFISIALLIVTAGFLMSIREGKIGPVYKEEDLIGVTDVVVTLPYSKQWGENVLFNDFLVSTTEPVFVDRYLVYSPVHSRVENRNVSEFSNSGSFYIQNGTFEDMVSAIYSNEELSKALISESPSNFLRIKSFENKFGQDEEKIQITFSCEREDLGINEIKPNFYYLSSDGKVEKSNETLLYFPGCSKVGEPETFTVEFKPPYVESGDFFMRLVGVLNSDMADVKIITPDTVIEPAYYSNGVGYSVIISKEQADSSRTKITNYIFGDSYDLSFDMSFDEDGKFNISQPINELVKEGKLKDSFLIWSTKKYLPIRLDQTNN